MDAKQYFVICDRVSGRWYVQDAARRTITTGLNTKVRLIDAADVEYVNRTGKLPPPADTATGTAERE